MNNDVGLGSSIKGLGKQQKYRYRKSRNEQWLGMQHKLLIENRESNKKLEKYSRYRLMKKQRLKKMFYKNHLFPRHSFPAL